MSERVSLREAVLIRLAVIAALWFLVGLIAGKWLWQ